VPEWDAEVEVDEGLARRLIRDSYPELDADSLRALGVGCPGPPSSLFPWPWFGSRVIEGHEISELGLDDVARGRLADDLGKFLRCLHRLSVPDRDALPFDPMGRSDMVIRVPRTRALLDQLDPSCALTDRAQAILSMAETLPPAADWVLAHGDLHVRLSAALTSFARAQGMPALEAGTLGGLERTL
jgi:aminoglycoside phosphotransferase (APT) family kinase protein